MVLYELDAGPTERYLNHTNAKLDPEDQEKLEEYDRILFEQYLLVLHWRHDGLVALEMPRLLWRKVVIQNSFA